MMDDRYSVQCLTAQVFLIRERIAVDGKPGPNDRLVRAFEVRHDADVFARSVNEKQMQLDGLYGHWVQHALRAPLHETDYERDSVSYILFAS